MIVYIVVQGETVRACFGNLTKAKDYVKKEFHCDAMKISPFAWLGRSETKVNVDILEMEVQ